MDCAYVARQRVFVANRPEDLVHYPMVSIDDQTRLSSTMALTATISLMTDSAAAPCLPTDEAESPGSSSNSTSTARTCRCIIDTSTQESLNRDFYNWLQGNDPRVSADRPCVFDDSTFYEFEAFGQQPSTSSFTDSYHPSAFEYAFDPNDQHALPTPSVSKRQKRSVAKMQPVENEVDPNPVSREEKRTETAQEEKPKKKRGGSNRGTNLYGRAYCPGRPLSMNERYQIICLFQSGMKVNAISKQLCISHGCVSKIITRFRETGLLIPSSHAECRRRKRMLMEAAAQQQKINNS